MAFRARKVFGTFEQRAPGLFFSPAWFQPLYGVGRKESSGTGLVSLKNFLVRVVCKVVSLELVMSKIFLVCLRQVVFLECITSRNILLRSEVQLTDQTDVPPIYK